MVNSLASTASAVSAAYARFDRAAGAVVDATSPDAAGNTGSIASAIVEMDQSRVQLAATLLVMRKSNDALASLLNEDYLRQA